MPDQKVDDMAEGKNLTPTSLEPSVVAYFIASHTNPRQVVRLVRRIRAERPTAPIMINHDRNCSQLSLEDFTATDNVHFVEPWQSGEWGTFSLVEQALAGVRSLFDSGEAFDWIAYLSGQDYPTGSLVDFESDLQSCGDGAIAWHDDRRGMRDRYRFAYYRLPRRFETRNMHRAFFILRLLVKFQPIIRFTSGRTGCRLGVRRSHDPRIKELRVFKGFQWWTLSRRSLEYVMEYISKRPDVVQVFAKRTIVPDEAFFQTILIGGGFNLRSDDGHFTKFEGDNWSPEFLGTKDLAEIAASNKPFARKIDDTKDAELLDLLDMRAGLLPLR